MPTSAPRPCQHPACRVLTYEGVHCPAHKKEKRKIVESRRESSTKRGYGYKWQTARAGFLRWHPLCACAKCQSQIEKIKIEFDLPSYHQTDEAISIEYPSLAAMVVDHITPHRGDKQLFWDRSNWQPMSKRCHDKKTATEDGGFTGILTK